jgi:hypothetical protein
VRFGVTPRRQIIPSALSGPLCRSRAALPLSEIVAATGEDAEIEDDAGGDMLLEEEVENDDDVAGLINDDLAGDETDL